MPSFRLTKQTSKNVANTTFNKATFLGMPLPLLIDVNDMDQDGNNILDLVEKNLHY